jgi:hypothetical protein
MEKNSVHQKLMDEAYDKWDNNVIKNYPDFLKMVMKDLGKLYYHAVITGNFNYQVGNGGFSQWTYNNYAKSTINSLVIFLEDNFANNDIVIEVLDLLYEYDEIIGWIDDGINELKSNCISSEYFELFQEKLNEYEVENLSRLDDRYYKVSNEFMNILEDYFKREIEKMD